MGNIRHTFTSPLRHDHTCHLLYSTYSKYEEDWSSYPHTHYFTELFFVLSGSGSFLVEDETFPIAKHDLIVINPNITHTEKSSLEDPLEYIVLGVDGLNFVIDDANEYLLFHSDEMKNRLDFYFRTILEETENSQKDYEKVCQNLLNILVVHLSRYASSSVEIFPFHKMESRECSRAKRYIDSSFQENITLDKLAEIAQINKYYFSHTFTETYGISPMNYLTQKRIFTSQELLTSTDMSLAQIAQQCGFSSSSYFTQCFRKSCGMTPTAYRKQFLRNQ